MPNNHLQDLIPFGNYPQLHHESENTVYGHNAPNKTYLIYYINICLIIIAILIRNAFLIFLPRSTKGDQLKSFK